MNNILIIPLLMSFFGVLFGMPLWIKQAKKLELVWEDMHKIGHPKNVSGSGGIIVLASFVISILIYIAIQTFKFDSVLGQVEIFAILASILIVGFIGFIDDIFGWKRGGLPRRFRILLIIFAAIPLMVINAGESTMLGIDFGLWYPLFLIPLGIVGVTTTFNFLAGYNGLESSQGIIILTALAIVTYLTGNAWLSLIALCMIFALLAFYIFNKTPALVFPGDVLTYSIGAMIAIMAIMGNVEKIAVFFFIPYIIEVILKSRGKLVKESFSNINEDGTLSMRYDKVYGLEHLAVYILNKTSWKATEKRVVYIINLFQILIITIGFLIFL